MQNLIYLCDAVKRLHLKSSSTILPTLSEKTPDAMINRLTLACEDDIAAKAIAKSILNNSQFRNTTIVALRATGISWFSNEDYLWPLIEWQESDGRRNLALFHFDDWENIAEGSWLMHSADGGGEQDDMTGTHSRVDFNVGSMEDLRILFGVVSYTLSMQEGRDLGVEQMDSEELAVKSSEEAYGLLI